MDTFPNKILSISLNAYIPNKEFIYQIMSMTLSLHLYRWYKQNMFNSIVISCIYLNFPKDTLMYLILSTGLSNINSGAGYKNYDYLRIL